MEDAVAVTECMHIGVCRSCGDVHDWIQDEHMTCIPPREIVCFGHYMLDPAYRNAIYDYCAQYSTEEVVGSFLGHNPHFKSQKEWLIPDDSDSDTPPPSPFYTDHSDSESEYYSDSDAQDAVRCDVDMLTRC